MIYKLIVVLILTAILAVGCSGSSPTQPQYEQTVGPLHRYDMIGHDEWCERHIGKTSGCERCHIML